MKGRESGGEREGGERGRERGEREGGERGRERGERGGEREEREGRGERSEEHTAEIQSCPHISYAVFCLKKKK